MRDDHVIFCIGLKLRIHARAILWLCSAIFQNKRRICIELDAIILNCCTALCWHLGIVIGAHFTTVEAVPVIIHGHKIALHRAWVEAAFIKQHHRIHRRFLLPKKIGAAFLNDIFNRDEIEWIGAILEKIKSVVVDDRILDQHLADHRVVICSDKCDELVLRMGR